MNYIAFECENGNSTCRTYSGKILDMQYEINVTFYCNFVQIKNKMIFFLLLSSANAVQCYGVQRASEVLFSPESHKNN